MVTATKQPQRAFVETEVNDPALEDIARRFYDWREAAREPSRNLRKAKKELKEAIAEKGLQDRVLNDRVRVGEYVISGSPMEGGPTEIPEWKSIRLKVERTLL